MPSIYVEALVNRNPELAFIFNGEKITSQQKAKVLAQHPHLAPIIDRYVQN
jgi:hypothetical protein